MNTRFLIAISVISILSGSAASLIGALSYYGRICGCPAGIPGTLAQPCCASPSAIGLVWQGTILVVMGVVVLLNLRRIEAIQERYRSR